MGKCSFPVHRNPQTSALSSPGKVVILLRYYFDFTVFDFLLFDLKVTRSIVQDLYCDCGELSAVRTVKKNGPNFGRSYQTCPKVDFRASCSFFQFAGTEEKSPVAQGLLDSPRDHLLSNLWVKCKSKSSGKTYYYNKSTDVTQWDCPT